MLQRVLVAGGIENEALENEDRSTKHPKTQKRSTQGRKRSTLGRKRSTLKLENHSYLRDWLGNLAMKTMVLQFMLEGPRPCTILCFNVHTTVEYLNKKVSIGQLLQHIPNSIVVCAGSRPKRQTKTYTAESLVSDHLGDWKKWS